MPDFKEFITTPKPEEQKRNIYDRTFGYYRWLWLISRKQNAKSKLQINTERGWIGHIWPWDLDRLAILFVTNRETLQLPINNDIWMSALAQFLTRADCGCHTKKCSSNYKLAAKGLPPRQFQALAHTLIDADTIRYANVLQKSPTMQHIINEEGADRLWGSQGSKDKDSHKGNYYYSPPLNNQIPASKQLLRKGTQGPPPKQWAFYASTQPLEQKSTEAPSH